MRRFLAVLLCVTLFAGMVPAGALADTLLYEYPSVNAYLAPNNVKTMEYELRRWAAEKLPNYVSGYLSRDLLYRLYDEYYHLATYKKWFDDTFGEEKNLLGKTVREIEYTSQTMTEEQYDELYLIAMLDTLKTMKKTDPDFMEKYLQLSDKQKRTYTLSVDGTWENNVFLEETDKKAKLDAANAWANLACDGIDLVAASSQACLLAAGNKEASKTAGTAEKIISIASSVAKGIAETITDSLKANAENEMRKYVLNTAVTNVMNAKEADIACLKTVYLSKDCKDDRAKKAAAKIVNLYKSLGPQSIASEIDEKKQIEEAEKAFGMEVQEELESSEIVMLCTIDAVCSLLKQLPEIISLVQKDGEGKKNQSDNKEGVKSNAKKDDQNEEDEIDDNSDIFKTLYDMIEKFIDKINEHWKEECIKEGKLMISFDSIFRLSEKDLNEILKECNMFDVLTDVMSVKDARKMFMDSGLSLEIRIISLYTYYATFELQEGYIDNVLDSKTNASERKTANDLMLASIKKNIVPFLKDALNICLDYKIGNLKNSLKIDSSTTQKLNENVKEAINKKIGKLEKVEEAIDIMEKVGKKAWQFGEDIVQIYSKQRDSSTGEDGMSELAQQVKVLRDLSNPLHLEVLGAGATSARIMDESAISVLQILRWCDDMKTALKHDGDGATNYFNIIVQSEGERKDTDFVKLLKGKGIMRHTLLKFDSITYDYFNIDKTRGLLTKDRADAVRDLIVDWYDKMNEGWKEEWRLLPALLQGEEAY